MSKIVKTLREAIELAGLKDGMTVSFHHHLRNGDYVLNLVMDEIARMGVKELTVNASSLFDTHAPLAEHIRNHVVRKIQTDYMSAALGRQISTGLMEEPVEFRTHGGRPSDIILGRTPIDIAFIAAPAADEMGNCTGKIGKSACGSLGYAFADAQCAKKTIVITDHLAPYPLENRSIPETDVDYVVIVDAIGDPNGIVSGTTKITRDPVGLMMAQMAAKAIQASGLLKDGFSFQTGAGGASLAAAMYLKQIMLSEQIHGSYGLGGITGYLVDMLREGCFRELLDVQCFDLKAVESIRSDPRHMEISGERYASPSAKSAAVDNLDVVILGATEIDTDFNVNVHTDSNGYIIDENGIDLAAVKEIKEGRRGRIKEYVETHPTATYTEGAGLWQKVKVDVALPCATQNELLIDDAKALVANGTQIVAEGANMPTTPDATEYLQQNGVYFVPGKASNAGGVATSALEMSQNSQRLSWSFDEVDSKLHGIMVSIYTAATSAAKEYNLTKGGKLDLVAGANIAGFLKVATAMMQQGVC